MNSKEILQALQARKISPEDAKKELAELVQTSSKPHSETDSSGLPERKGLSRRSLNRFSFQKKSPKPMEETIQARAIPQIATNQENGREAIAIIGISGRYPDAADLGEYWDNLVHAKNSIREIPDNRWDVNRYYDPRSNQPGKIYCKWLGALDDIEYFDPLFFNITPAEAEVMDPQQRLFLQEGYRAFEDAGYDRRRLSNTKCGVYLGLMSNEYGLMLYKNKAEAMSTTGNSSAIAAARIAYYLNLKGPAISIDTACSSSLVASHLACQALINHETDMALVGGVTLYLLPDIYISMCAAGMLSFDGQCKTFDNSADGFVPAEGVGALVLKRLSDAEADNDHIYGLIVGSGINQNGNTNGITAPSKNSQIELERDIYDKYHIHPETVSYIETHGTGTKLGDLMELEALSTVFKEKTKRKNYCAVGSVKSNLGHTSAAAGVASVHKVLMCLEHQKLVPTLNFKKPNEHFNFDDSPFYVNTDLKSWESISGAPRRACVSSFGYSGSNAHLVIEEYLPRTSVQPRPINSSAPVLFVLSARTEEQLQTYAVSLQSYLDARPNLNLADLAYTLQVGRQAMEYRLACLADSKAALRKVLEEFINQNTMPGMFTTRSILNEAGNDLFEPDDSQIASLIQKRDYQKIAELWVNGSDIDWNQLYSDFKPQRISLPTYPFKKERCWAFEGPVESDVPPGRSGDSPSNPRNKFQIYPEVYVYDELYLKDHKVNGEQVLIGMTHASLAANAFFKIFPLERSLRLQRLNFIKPIEVKKGERVEVLVEPAVKGAVIDFQVLYRLGFSGAWNLTATGTLQKAVFTPPKIALNRLRETLKKVEHFDYIFTKNPAIELGDTYKIITELYAGPDQVLARVVLHEASRKENHAYVLHPLIVYIVFHAVVPLLEKVEMKDGFLPFGIKEISFQKTGGLDQFWTLVRLNKYSGEMVVFDASVIDDQSEVVATFSGCSTKRLRLSASAHFSSPDPIAVAPFAAVFHHPQSLQPGIAPNSSQLSGLIQKYLLGKLSRIITNRSRLTNLETNLMDLGLESSQLIALTEEIEKEADILLNPALFFEYPNIKELTKFFCQEHQSTFLRLLGAEPKKTANFNEVQPASGMAPPVKTVAQISRPDDFMSQDLYPDLSNSVEPFRDDIAVIGMQGMFSGASDLEQYWEILRDQKDVMFEIPIDHWDYRPWFNEDPEAKDRTYCKWGGFIGDVDKFDASFFNISPREAEWMDPQLRLLLQSIYVTAEDAGYINQLRGTNTGVFIGVCCHEYMERINELKFPVDPYVGTGNNHTVIANRLSFFYDLTGPSIAVDTACSSSLVALHLACQAIRNRECNMAFVGAANLLLSSWHYRYFSSIGALSPTGRCHTFDEAADGYVPGEGIASMLLKPLQQAIKDGDHIYAVIKGSAALHGGYTPSLTAPSVAGEENVIVKAWEDARIDPETLTYIEAHGTGTKLGDPIEVNSIKKAFKRFTDKTHFCAIGSAKASIGHTEGAAGLAGIFKVILQMKYGQIPALPKFKKLNPYIDLNRSALYINQEMEEWKVMDGAPRRAGVSSFGFSGAYAHVVVEEYLPPDQDQAFPAVTAEEPAMIVLSAKNEERLLEKAKQLLRAIREQQFTDNDLRDIAYILQLRREAMEERLGVIAGSMGELEEKLTRFVAGQENIEELYRGEVKRNQETLAVFTADEDMANMIDAWISKRKYGKLLDLWVKGLVFDWNKLYGATKSRHRSLPAYPFAKERYWLPEFAGEPVRVTGWSPQQSTLHPLAHQNTSDFSEQRFSTTFTGREFFLADHMVKGRRVLPGVAYLEMAREAIHQSAAVSEEERVRIQLKNVVWLRPVVVEDQPVKVNVALYPEENGEIVYEIYSTLRESGPSQEKGDETIHCQGCAILSPMDERPCLDLASLQNQGLQRTFSPTQVYESFKAMGIEYGPGHRGIEEIYTGTDLVLAKLSLPASVADTRERFFLHPSMMDSALQASIVLNMDLLNRNEKNPPKTLLPFAAQEVEIFEGCTSVMWALIRNSETMGGQDRAKDQGRVQKVDFDLCDEQGNVLVRIKEFSSRVLEGEITAQVREAGATANFGRLMLEPIWKKQAVTSTPGSGDTSESFYEQRLVIFCEMGAALNKEKIETGLGARLLILQSKQKGLEERFQTYAARIFEEIQSILEPRVNGKANLEGKALIQIVVPHHEEQMIFSGLSGLLKTARLENPKIFGQLLELEPGLDLAGMVAKINENSRRPTDDRIRYQDGQRMIMLWSEIDGSRQGTVKDEGTFPWKDQGIYLITGGVGGLGMIMAREIIKKAQRAVLILTDRAPLSGEKQAQLAELEEKGAKVVYRQVDVTDKKAVTGLIQSIREEFGSLHGVFHCAGMIRDNFIIKKTREEFLEVLYPKVKGLVNLDQASKDLSLDFFVLFSSIAGNLGNAGQADYSTANAFMDAYAEYRNNLLAAKQRQGRTIAFNWPLWKEGGMRIAEETEQMILQSTGMIPMRTATGVQALYQGLASGKTQVMVLEGMVGQLRNYAGMESIPHEVVHPKEKSEAADDYLKEKTLEFVKETLAKAVKLPPEKIDPDKSFEKYGVDSLLQMSLIRELEKVVGRISKTLLFEYTSTQELTDYLLKNHSDSLMKAFASERKEVLTSSADEAAAGSFAVHQKRRTPRFAGAYSNSQAQIFPPQEAEDIAIIGISGRYPMSNTLEELWEHLKAGDNCITEVPANRWRTSLIKMLCPDEPGGDFHGEGRYYGGFLDGIERFDHYLFDIALEQVRELTPEARLFLEIVWETFEDAGYNKQLLQELQTKYQSGVGVFVGTMYNQYSIRIPLLDQALLSTNVTDWQIANRASHFFNLTGPSIAINSACSSSLTAIHLACESLKQRNCSMAIAGGVNLSLDPSKYEALRRTKFLGSGNLSKSFGAGDGYIPGEGVGAVLLKPLSLAVKEQDRIYGVIKSSFINHSGGRQIYAAPDPKQQTQLIINSIQRAGIDPATIGYVESAANGSELGDPIEVVALNNAFKQYTNHKQFCALGSVKSNLGHLEAASGISQLTKALLQLKHRTLTPTLNALPRNPNIILENSAFYLQEETRPWEQMSDPQTGRKLPRRSMINSFGAGGSYSNLIVEEYMGEPPRKEPGPNHSGECLMVFSAKTEWSLFKRLEKIMAYLRKNSPVPLDDLSLALMNQNHALPCRTAILAASTQKLMEKLAHLQKERVSIVTSDIYLSSDFGTEFGPSSASEVKTALEKKDLRDLARRWVGGANIDWRALNQNSGIGRLDLPKYAFDHNLEFGFDGDGSVMSNQAEELNEDYFRGIFEKIAQGELTEDEFRGLISI